MSNSKLIGKVKWFDSKKGFGFITGEDGKDLFIHYSDIQGSGFKNLLENEQVYYKVGESDKGLKAVEVEKG